jgi:LuxR family transcriptional regulator, maltose regulon positive regulatory protein
MVNRPEVSGATAEIVKTKLRAPKLRSEYVPRPGLIELLEASSDCKLTLMSAPTGYGKTTLLTQWRQSEKGALPFAWVSLDEQDNDPVRLWRHVLAALREVAPEEGFGADVLVGLGVVGTKLVETALPVLINQLTGFPYRIVLVLDDFHYIKDGGCHESVSYFIEHLPDTVHVVLSTRSYPSLNLGRLRARGEMNELSTEQFAFSQEEAASLLEGELRLDIGPDDLSSLYERTEGWPAALYLAGLSLRTSKDKHAFIRSFHGSNRYIIDLMGEEVLAGLPEEERKLLLRTSVLEKMSSSLCDAVMGTVGSGKLLQELVHSNLFVVPLSGDRGWYRYHHLFADFLFYELESTQPDLVPVLRGRASAWFEGEGSVGTAITYAIAAAEYERAGALIARHSIGYLATGRTATLRRWLDSLPEGFVNGDAALLLLEAWICAMHGQREESERFLTLAESSSYTGELPDGTVSIEAGVAIVRATFGFRGVRDVTEAARRAIALDPDKASPWAVMMRFGLGGGLYFAGDASRARKPLEEGLRLTTPSQPLFRIVILSLLSFVASDEGRLEDAEALAREAGALVDRFGLWKVPQVTWAPIALGSALAKRGKLAGAETELESGLSARRRWPGLNPWPNLLGLLALAPVRLARGDRDGARALLAEARAILDRNPDAGIFPGLLEREERRLRTSQRQEGTSSEEFTERELDVLRLLPGEFSTGEMGSILYVATSTVRTHIKSIYRKLGVSSRKNAVEQARARGLV